MNRLLSIAIFITALSFNSFAKNSSHSKRIANLQSIQTSLTSSMSKEILSIIKNDYKSSYLLDKITNKSLEKAPPSLILNSLIGSVDPTDVSNLQVLEAAIGRTLIKHFISL